MFSRILIIIFFLLVLLLVAPDLALAVNYNTIYTMSACSNCLSFAVYSCGGTDCTTFDCSSKSASGIAGRRAIIRSKDFNDFIVSAATANIDEANQPYLVDGSDSATEGTWMYSTGEVFHIGAAGGTTPAFAYTDYGDGEPNDWDGAEDTTTLHWWISTNSWKWNDAGTVTKSVVCSFEHQVFADRVIDSSGVSSLFNLAATTKYARYEVFPEHVAQLTAFRRCESTFREDPNTGKNIGGYLAVIFMKQDYTLIQQLLDTKSDVKWHSSDSNFGAWLGANTSSDKSTQWEIEGTRTVEKLNLRKDAGGDSLYTYSSGKFGTSAGALAANQGVQLSTVSGANQWKFKWVNKQSTLPYVCRWNFNPKGTIRITIPSHSPPAISAEDPEGKTTAPAKGGDNKLTTFMARYYSEWRTVAQARDYCWGQVETNELGDSSRGLNGVLLEKAEWSLVDKLAQGSGYFSADADLTADIKGIFLDVQTSTDVGWSTLGELKTRNSRGLVFNRNGKLPYTPESLPWEARMYQPSGSGDCVVSQYCPTMEKWDSDQSGQRTALAFSRDTVYTAKSNRRRPYVCTYRFPVRALIEPWLVLEYHPYPMSADDARKVCKERKVKIPDPKSSGGPLAVVVGTFAPFPRFALSKVQQWLTDVVSGGSSSVNLQHSGRVWLGGQHGSECQAWARAAEVMRMEPCTIQYEFVCQFVYPGETRTLSRSGTNTSEPGRTRSNSTTFATNSPSSSSSHSVSESGASPTRSDPITVSGSESLSESESPTRSDPITVSGSESLSESESAATRSSSNPSPSSSSSRTESRSQTLSEMSPTASDSAFPTDTSSLTRSASLLPTESATVSSTSSGSSTAGLSASGSAGTASTSAEITLSPTQGSPSRSDSAPTLTEHIVARHIRPAEIQTLQDISSVASLFSGGAIAVQRSRLEAADALARCGDPHQVLDEEPDFMSSPFGWQIGDETVKTRYQRGATVGNIVAVVVSTAGLYVIAIIFGLLRFKSWRRGIDALRLPGVALVPVAVLTAPSVEAAGTLLWHGEDTAIARLLGIASLFFMVGCSMAVVIQVSRLVTSGIVVLRSLPPTVGNESCLIKKIKASHCGRQVCKLCAHLFLSDIGWVGQNSISEYLDLVSGKQSKEKAELAIQSKSQSKGEIFLIGFGAIFEDFGYFKHLMKKGGCCCGGGADESAAAAGDTGGADSSSWGPTTCAFFSAIDLGVSIVLGWCAGVASGELNHTQCVFWLSMATASTAYHTFVLLYYRPCLVIGTQWFISIGSVLTTVTVGLSFASYMTRKNKSFQSETITDKIMLSQAAVGMFMVLISAGYTLMFFIEFVDAWSTGEDLRELEKHTRQQLSLYSAGNDDSMMAGGRGGNKSGKSRARQFDEELQIMVSAMLPREEEEFLTGVGGAAAIPMSPRSVARELGAAGAASTTNNSPNVDEVSLSHSQPLLVRRTSNRNRNAAASRSVYEDEEEDELFDQDAYAALLAGDDGDDDDGAEDAGEGPLATATTLTEEEMLADQELDDLLGKL